MNDFIITGQICSDKKTIPGLKVVACGRDLLSDNQLGEAISDKEGRYNIKYSQGNLENFLLGKKNEVYLKVFNQEKQLVYFTEKKISCNSEHVQEMNLEIHPNEFMFPHISATPMIQAPDCTLGLAELDKSKTSNIKENVDVSIYSKSVDYKTTYQKEASNVNYAKLLQMSPNNTEGFSQVMNHTELVQLSFDPKDLILIEGNNQIPKYQEITCVDMFPDHDLLEAVVYIKLGSSYSKGLCDANNYEYITFYLDWDDGLGYQQVAIEKFNVCDIVKSDEAMHFAIQTRIENMSARLQNCNKEKEVKVRAILSWNYENTLV